MNLNVICACWNVNGELPTDSLCEWFLHKESKKDPTNSIPDAVFIGIEELISYHQYHLAWERKEAWSQSLQNALDTVFGMGRLQLVYADRFVALGFWVFVSTHWMDLASPHTNNTITTTSPVAFLVTPAASFLGVGLFGFFGNKGGMGVQLSIRYDHPPPFEDGNQKEPVAQEQWIHLCALHVHLMAETSSLPPSSHGQSCVEKRHQSLQRILRFLSFNSSLQSHQEVFHVPKRVENHNVLLLMGDLNYRMDATRETVCTVIKENDISTLLTLDQLHQSMNSHPVLGAFKEAPITFLPTYKYLKNTSGSQVYSTKRTPSYCDRILYSLPDLPHFLFSTQIDVSRYHSITNFTHSDHKPIIAHLSISSGSKIFKNDFKSLSFERGTSLSILDHTLQIATGIGIMIIEMALILWSLLMSKVLPLLD